MKLELIVPPSPFLGDEKRSAPLSILYLAAVARNQCEVKINDLREKSQSLEVGDADIYGITATTPDYPAAKKIAEICKKKNPKAWIVLGGVHATALPNEIDAIFGKLIVGEGEISLMEILKDYELGNNEKRIYSSEMIQDIDTIPFPARDLAEFDSVFSKNALFSGDSEYATTIMTSRGCFNNCSFCASDKMWHRKLRFRSAENVLDEIKEIKDKWGVRNLRFQDDTMTLNEERLKKLCAGMKALGIRWRVGTRVDKVNYEMLKMMKESGCDEVAYGIESLDQDVLNKNSKNIKIEDIDRAMRASKAAGMMIRAYFIIGLPREKPGFADRIERFAKEYSPEAINIHTFVPFPGSPVYHNPEKYGIKLKDKDFSSYIMTLGLGKGELEQDFTFVHDVMSEEQLKEERRKAIEFVRDMKLVKNY